MTSNNLTSFSISVLLGKGDGTFEAAKTTSTGVGPVEIALADVNLDGVPDITVTDNYQIQESLGNGDGTFRAQNSFTFAGAHLVVTDFNGDGTFKAPVTYSLGGTDANAVLVKDVNRDGKLDVISVNYGTSTVSVFLGNGDGTFRAARQFAVTQNPTVIAAGDFNRDRKVDLAVASATTVSILLGDGVGGFSRGHDVPVGQGVDGIVAVDLRGNGISDLVLADAPANVAILLSGKGDGTFAAPISFATVYPSSLATGDFNGDGAPDVAMALLGATAIPVFYNQGGTYIALASSNKTPKAGQSVTFTATIAASLPGNSTPTGTVAFKNGITTLGTATLSGGKATFTYSALAKGSHTITAAYSGNSNFNPHTSPGLTEAVQ